MKLEQQLNEITHNMQLQNMANHIDLTSTLKKSTDDIRTALNDNASSMIASHEWMENSLAQEMQSMGSQISSQISTDIHVMQAVFEQGLHAVCWQLEKNQQLMSTIIDKLSSPLDAQAKELRKRAEMALSNGWYEEALKDFLKSESINPYDYLVHLNIANIYATQLNDPNNALTYYDKAIKFAYNQSVYYYAYALFFKAVLFERIGDIGHALDTMSNIHTHEATLKDAWFLSESFFRVVIYRAKSGQFDKDNLQKAILLDKYFVVKAYEQPDLQAKRRDIDALLQELYQTLEQKLTKKAQTIKGNLAAMKEFFDVSRNTNGYGEIFTLINSYLKKYQTMTELMARKTYFDLLDASHLTFDDIQKSLLEKADQAKHIVKGEKHSQLTNQSNSDNNHTDSLNRGWNKFVTFLKNMAWFFLAYGYPLMLVLMHKKSILDQVFAFVPLINIIMCAFNRAIKVQFFIGIAYTIGYLILCYIAMKIMDSTTKNKKKARTMATEFSYILDAGKVDMNHQILTHLQPVD